MLIYLIIVIGVVLGWLILTILNSMTSKKSDYGAALWDKAIEETRSSTAATFLKITRPLGTFSPFLAQLDSKQYARLQNKLLITGLFYSSVEIFMAIEAVAVFFAVLEAIAVVLFSNSLLTTMFGIVLAFLLVYMPYSHVASRAEAKIREVTQNLPDFAEMFLLTIGAKSSIMESLAITADNVPGPLSVEMKNLRTLLDSRTFPSEEEAFALIGKKLGSASAASFMKFVMEAYLEGSGLTDILESQAATLRNNAYQEARAALKKLPNRIEVIITIAAAPLMLIVTIYPSLVSFRGL